MKVKTNIKAGRRGFHPLNGNNSGRDPNRFRP